MDFTRCHLIILFLIQLGIDLYPGKFSQVPKVLFLCNLVSSKFCIDGDELLENGDNLIILHKNTFPFGV